MNINEYVANRVIKYLKERDDDTKQRLLKIGVINCGVCDNYEIESETTMCDGCGKKLCNECFFWYLDSCRLCGCLSYDTTYYSLCMKCADGCEHGCCSTCKMNCTDCASLNHNLSDEH